MTGVIISGLVMGLAGSFHCIGMCGPLALSLPLGNKGRSRIFPMLSYNIGRAFTYFLIGSLLGLTGSRLVVAGYQQLFSISLGVLVLLALALKKLWPSTGRLRGLHLRLKIRLSFFLQRNNNSGSAFVFGVLNGLLPCGMVYLAIASALIIGTPLQAGLFMAAFGMGTLPLMTLLLLTGRFMSFRLKRSLSQLVPLFIFFVAVLMILRGLNLGIPLVSPAFNVAGTAAHCSPLH